MAHALPRTGPSAGSPIEAEIPASTGAVIRAVPSVRAEPEVPADAVLSDDDRAPVPGPTDDAPRGSRRGRRAPRGPGLRERRRQETRDRFVDGAAECLAERVFVAVRVMEFA